MDGPIRIADQVMGQHFIQPLEQVMHRCGMLSELIERRERNKMDYNSYVRKVRRFMKEKNGAVQSALSVVEHVSFDYFFFLKIFSLSFNQFKKINKDKRT